MGPTTRTFVALPLSSKVERAIGKLQEELGKASDVFRWLPASNIHLTLAFLGDVPTPETDRVCRAVAGAVAELPEFEVEPMGLGMFGSPRRPRTLWVGIERGKNELEQLFSAIANALAEAGFDVDRRFTAHLTIGRPRLRFRRRGPIETWPHEYADWRAERMPVSEVLTMASQLDVGGSIYTVLGRAPLMRIR